MSTNDSSHGIDSRYLLHRKLKLATVNSEQADQLVEALESTIGFTDVELDLKRKLLKIGYDASYKNLDHVIEVLETHNFSVSDSRWQKMRMGWYRNTDENVAESVKHVPHCCSKMPPGH